MFECLYGCVTLLVASEYFFSFASDLVPHLALGGCFNPTDPVLRAVVILCLFYHLIQSKKVCR